MSEPFYKQQIFEAFLILLIKKNYIYLSDKRRGWV